jgi:hypothetical protein
LGLCISHIAFGQEPTISTAIEVPEGYLRLKYPNDSFSNWIQNLPLKTQPVILDHQGRVVQSGFYNVWGVVRMPVLFRSDMEQCADFAMRFWAEYHKDKGMLDRLYLFDYSGRKKYFVKSGQQFRQFLATAFSSSNSHSLKIGCKEAPEDQLIPGDMFIQNERGGIGHVSVVVDVCQSTKGQRLLLIGYSFMPAQEFHIEKAETKYGIGGWFTLEGYTRYLLDHLNYGKPVLRRFDP